MIAIANGFTNRNIVVKRTTPGFSLVVDSHNRMIHFPFIVPTSMDHCRGSVYLTGQFCCTYYAWQSMAPTAIHPLCFRDIGPIEPGTGTRSTSAFTSPPFTVALWWVAVEVSFVVNIQHVNVNEIWVNC